MRNLLVILFCALSLLTVQARTSKNVKLANYYIINSERVDDATSFHKSKSSFSKKKVKHILKRISSHFLVKKSDNKQPVFEPQNEGLNQVSLLNSGYKSITSGVQGQEELNDVNTTPIFKENNDLKIEVLSPIEDVKPVLAPLAMALDNSEMGVLPNDFYYENNIYYDYNKISVRQEAIPTLDSLARVMMKYPDLNIEFEGHTDSRGKAQYNYQLSLKRTTAAAQYLIEKGISRNRIKKVAKGETALANDCNEDIYCNETAHQSNRRTVIKLRK